MQFVTVGAEPVWQVIPLPSEDASLPVMVQFVTDAEEFVLKKIPPP
jgi:hypothetical protein